MSSFAVVPVKELLKSKTRLSTLFTPQERSLLTLTMLEDVLNAITPSVIHRIVVIGSDEPVEKMSKSFGANFLKETQHGLNEALNQATNWCLQNGAGLVLVLPADIPLIRVTDVNQLVKLALNGSVVISPSTNGGTNALLQAPPKMIPLCFGHESFEKHLENGLARGVHLKIYVSSNIMIDIDSDKDLKQVLELGEQTASYRFLKNCDWKRSALS